MDEAMHERGRGRGPEVRVTDLYPGLGPTARSRAKKSDQVLGTNLAGQILGSPGGFLDVYPDDKTESISNLSDMDREDPATDHEEMSGLEEDETEALEKTEWELPGGNQKIKTIGFTQDGTAVVSEEQVEALVKEEVTMDQYFRETENASPVSDHLHLTEDEMDDIPRDFSCANPVDIPFLDKKFEGRRRSSLAAIHIYKQQLQSSSRKNSSANADVIRTQIAESTILSSLDSDRVGEGQDDEDEEECPTQSEQIETKGTLLHSTLGT